MEEPPVLENRRHIGRRICTILTINNFPSKIAPCKNSYFGMSGGLFWIDRGAILVQTVCIKIDLPAQGS